VSVGSPCVDEERAIGWTKEQGRGKKGEGTRRDEKRGGTYESDTDDGEDDHLGAGHGDDGSKGELRPGFGDRKTGKGRAKEDERSWDSESADKGSRL
jgi:hypothetical protein